MIWCQKCRGDLLEFCQMPQVNHISRTWKCLSLFQSESHPPWCWRTGAKRRPLQVGNWRARCWQPERSRLHKRRVLSPEVKTTTKTSWRTPKKRRGGKSPEPRYLFEFVSNHHPVFLWPWTCFRRERRPLQIKVRRQTTKNPTILQNVTPTRKHSVLNHQTGCRYSIHSKMMGFSIQQAKIYQQKKIISMFFK